MATKDKILQLANERNNPSVTISMNTHRVHPDTTKDSIQLKNLLAEAEKQVLDKYERSTIEPLLANIVNVGKEIDVRLNLDSLHIFLSNNNKEYIRLTWPTYADRVIVGDKFDIRSVIKSFSRVEEYFILVLSQGGVHLYEAMNDTIAQEIHRENFPFTENPYYVTNLDLKSDPDLQDDMIRKFFREVDQSVVKIFNEEGLNVLVISTAANYSFLQQVASKPEIYVGHSLINYNNASEHDIIRQGWELFKDIQFKNRTKAIVDMNESVSEGLVITDLQEMYRAVVGGRGDVLIIHEDFSQPVKMTGEKTFEFVDDPTMPDITSAIAWEVLSKNGRVFFTNQDEIKELGPIVLKTRYK